MSTGDPAAAPLRSARHRMAGRGGVTAALTAETRAEIERQRARYPHPRSAVLPSLWALQNQIGYLSPEGMAEIADLLGVTSSDVQAVATFYSMYFDRPGGRHHILLCINVSCALRDADAIASHLERTLGCPSGGTTADGEFTWEQTVECLGACGGAPAMQVDHHFHENLTPERVDAILDRVRGTPPAHGHGTASPVPDGPRPPVGGGG
jgi:NADH-quinone oxidoreductase subunit E